uniref:HTH CENPB-type domain-containing protein n=1 Tax=Arion vulgaris TaxID=1028688 RepID=A0A0B7ALY1_9EUPU
MQWIQQRCSENLPLTPTLIITQAKIFHEQLGITALCEYSSDWYGKFQEHHGLHISAANSNSENILSFHKSSATYVDEFKQLVADEQLSAEQVYNVSATSLFWKYIPQKIVSAPQRSTSNEDFEERLTVLVCSNAAGTHKTRLLVVSKSKDSHLLKDVNIFPVIHADNEQAWITKSIFQEWFENHFVHEARAHCRSAGLSNEAKIMLILDNCSANPSADTLTKDNVFAVHLPPNCPSWVQPLNQGVLSSLKLFYKAEFLRKMLVECGTGVTAKEFQSNFNIRDAIWSIAEAWNKVDAETLMHGWYHLWPSSLFMDEGMEHKPDFIGLRLIKEKQIVAELMDYAKCLPCPEAQLLNDDMIQDYIRADNDVPVASFTDSEMCSFVKNEIPDNDNDVSEDKVAAEDIIMSVDRMISLAEDLIHGMERRSFISEQQITSAYKIKVHLLKEKQFQDASYPEPHH